VTETIAAIATPPGAGGIAVVRISGPAARSVALRTFKSSQPLRDRVATFGTIVGPDGEAIDRGLALFFAGPRSFTGEDVVELHVHGSPIVARDALTAAIAAGARLARAGEFTRRALEAGKIDLVQAEAIGALVAAEHRAEARIAAAGLGSGLARELQALRAALAAVIEDLAAALDFPDEVAAPDRADLEGRLRTVEARVRALGTDFERGLQERGGTLVAIVGPPNAGKSSLLNALLRTDRALVSERPGTTRDTIDELLALEGVRLRIVDTAGLRDAADPVERAGIERSRRSLESAQIVLVVIDGSQPLDADAVALLAETRERERIVFFNKADLGDAGYRGRQTSELQAIAGSTRDADTVAAIERALLERVRGSERPDPAHPHLVSARQAAAALAAADSLSAALAALAAGDPIDLCAGDLIAAIASLDAISGRDAGEAVLDGIFARFCIGK
jgi:tRNA modification GTPase